MLVQFTSILTSTIVSTAAPTIVGELHGLDLYAWLFSSYMLASSVTVPVVGKLSDLFGRRPFYIAGLLVFLLGSAGSGLSQNMGELIAARALTGIGGGALMALGVTTIGDIFSPRERGRWMGLIMSVFGLGSIVGPLVGGFITDHFGWRWVFLRQPASWADRPGSDWIPLAQARRAWSSPDRLARHRAAGRRRPADPGRLDLGRPDLSMGLTTGDWRTRGRRGSAGRLCDLGEPRRRADLDTSSLREPRLYRRGD